MCVFSVHHPESGRGRRPVSSPGFVWVGCFGPVVLTARVVGLAPPGQVGNVCRSTPRSSERIGSHKRPVTGPVQELGIDERTEQRFARCSIQSPKPLCLRRRQPKPGHLDVFTLNASQNIVECSFPCDHEMPPYLPVRGVMERLVSSNACATAGFSLTPTLLGDKSWYCCSYSFIIFAIRVPAFPKQSKGVGAANRGL